MLPVEDRERLSSPECIGCLTCVSNCPAKGALDVALPGKKWVNPLVYISLLIIIFWGSIAIAKATNHWDAGVAPGEYERIIPHLEKLEHP
jgi:ferredoxin